MASSKAELPPPTIVIISFLNKLPSHTAQVEIPLEINFFSLGRFKYLFFVP